MISIKRPVLLILLFKALHENPENLNSIKRAAKFQVSNPKSLRWPGLILRS